MTRAELGAVGPPRTASLDAKGWPAVGQARDIRRRADSSRRSHGRGALAWLTRATEFVLVFVLFPIAVLIAVAIAIAVSLTGLFAYVGALLAAWLLFAFVVPLATGIMTWDEIVAGFRSQRRRGTHFEGEPLPEDRALTFDLVGEHENHRDR